MASISSTERLRLSEEKARNWLTSVDPENYDDLESVLESIAQSSIVESSDSESGEEQQLGKRTNEATLATSNYDTVSGEIPMNLFVLTFYVHSCIHLYLYVFSIY